MTSMSINDRLLFKQIMLIGLSSAKLLLWGVNVVHFSYNHNVVSNLICRRWNKLPIEFLDPFLQSEFRLRAQLFMKEMVKIYFGLLKIQVKFLIN